MKDSSQRQHIAQFPAAAGPYKVVLNSPSIWRDYSTCRLQISVGKPKHEGDKFFALTEWAAARFDKVYLIVSDTLQRHNLALEIPAPLAGRLCVCGVLECRLQNQQSDGGWAKACPRAPFPLKNSSAVGCAHMAAA